jgi:MerR HTH family regulatory protein
MTIPLVSSPPVASRDTLQTLRTYHALAPWSLRDLAALAGTLLEASGVVPVNVAARARPSERTIRFYVMKGLVDPPEGRGTAAVYRYRHLLQVLGIKLRQMDGASLDVLAKEFSGLTGDILELRSDRESRLQRSWARWKGCCWPEAVRLEPCDRAWRSLRPPL